LCDFGDDAACDRSRESAIVIKIVMGQRTFKFSLS
jgi:hypothetical protein